MADYATLLRDHTTLMCRSVDRFFLQGYVPRLQSVGRVCRFLRWQRQFRIPASAAFGKIGDGYVRDVHRFAEANGVTARIYAANCWSGTRRTCTPGRALSRRVLLVCKDDARGEGRSRTEPLSSARGPNSRIAPTVAASEVTPPRGSNR
jgi:hypothetical protein